MTADIVNSSNFQAASSATQVAARTAFSNSPKQPVAVSPDEGSYSAAPARQILPVGKSDSSETVQVESISVEPTSEELRVVVEKLNNQIQALQRELSFSVDEDSGRTVVRVVDSNTNEVVRQIPSDQVLKLARQLEMILSEASQQVSGVLVEEQA